MGNKKGHAGSLLEVTFRNITLKFLLSFLTRAKELEASCKEETAFVARWMLLDIGLPVSPVCRETWVSRSCHQSQDYGTIEEVHSGAGLLPGANIQPEQILF